jgi:hypothetical protein
MWTTHVLGYSSAADPLPGHKLSIEMPDIGINTKTNSWWLQDVPLCLVFTCCIYAL